MLVWSFFLLQIDSKLATDHRFSPTLFVHRVVCETQFTKEGKYVTLRICASCGL